jgi:hypothetical protein
MADLSVNLIPLTDLEAVNGMLAIIGEAPVATIIDTGSADVNLATQLLRNASRRVQTRGWSFNVDKEYPVTRDTSGFINLPANALAASVSLASSVRAVQRGSKLWDLENRTFVWTTDVKMDFVWFQPFNELPDHARQLIFYTAAFDFAQSQMATTQILKSAMMQLETSQQVFKQTERRIAKPNVYRDSSTGYDLMRDTHNTYIPGRW